MLATVVRLALIGLCLLLCTTTFALGHAGTRKDNAASTRRLLRFEVEQLVYDELELDVVVGDEKQQRSLLSTSSKALASNELQALQALYDALGGSDWQWQQDTATYGMPWNFTKGGLHDPCEEQWQGVYCSCNNNTNITPLFPAYYYYDNVPDAQDTSYCNVAKIVLNRYGLVGTLPTAAFGAFSHLSHLYMGGNKIQGDFSSSLCSLRSNISVLGMYNNSLTGTLPSTCIAKLTNLRSLSLGDNHLEGNE
jgi:Leucine-rich repeat (LRR) protein